jgi:hypothetical protein
MIAGAMLKYDKRKDKWTRVFGTIFGTDLYLFHTKPTPRSYRGGADSSDYRGPFVASVDRPKWLGQGGAVVVDLSNPGIVLSLEANSTS